MKKQHQSSFAGCSGINGIFSQAARCLAKVCLGLTLATLSLTTLMPQIARAFEYPYAPYNEGKMDSQLTGWPLTEQERTYVLKAEFERRPGREINQHKPDMWPVTPSAGFWGGTSWLDTHANLVKVAQAAKGPIDVLLVGDSITMQWGAAWPKHFPTLKTVNIGIGGDKTQNVLWRLDHGGVEGLEPRVCVLLIGNNNMFFTPETGIGPAAQGIKVCVENLREKFPQAPVIVVKVFPAHTPGNPFYEDIKKVNAALGTLNLEADPKVRVLDIWGDMVNADGTLKKELFTPDNIHLSQDGGYKLYAEKLKPLLEAFLAGKEVPKSTPRTYPASTPAPSPAPAGKPAAEAKPAEANAEPARAKQVIYDDNLAPGWINNPIQATVTLDNTSPAANGSKSIAVNSSPYGGFQLLRWGTTLDTTLSKSLTFRIHGGAKGGQNLRVAMLNGMAEGHRWQIVPVPEANAWTTFRIALSDLGVANTRNLYGLRIWEAGGVDATYYLDDIQLSDEEVPSFSGVVFDDVFRGFWFNNPFAADVVATNTTPVHGGVFSLAVTITGGGGCAQISHGGTFPDTSPYDSLSFWIHGGPSGGQKLQLFVKRWNADVPDVDVPAWDIPALAPNTWVKHTVPLSVLNAANATNVASIWFRDASTGTAQPTFYLDDIRFEAASGASPASAAKPAPVASKPAAPAAARPTPSEAQKPGPAVLVGVAPQPTTIKDGVLVYPYAPYNAGKMDPQLKGWPLTEAERAYVIQPENIARMPGREPGAHGDLPAMWPVTPSAGYWGGTNATDTQWLDHHTTLVNMVQSNQGPVDIVLVGDSITQGWGGGWEKTPFNLPWQTHFSQYQTLNLGIGGDRTEHILWRLDHGGLDGVSPKVIVLLIGVNDTPMITPNGIPPAAVAEGIKLCALNVKEKCPKAQVVVVKILPGFKSDTAVHKDVQRVNAALDELNLGKIPGVHVLDLQQELANADGSVKPEAYNGDHLHLNETGYDIFASRLQPLITKLIGRRGNSTGDADLPCSIRLSVVEEHPEALIKKGTPGTEGIKYGLEGGSAIKLDGVYHVFTAEMLGDPQWVKMRLGHWTSTNRLHWTRVQTMYESSGDPTGKDPRASFWSPMPIYDEKQKLWNFFYVAYRAQVGPLGWNGRVWRAVSKVKGPEGINGPWEDVGVILQPGPAGGAWEDAVMSGTVDSKTILQPGPESDPWEGSQGVDSFYPYKVGGKWMGFYGSCNGHSWFKVGLAESPKLAGPWKRVSALNPVTIAGTRGTENPVVTRLKSGRYVALFEIVARENGFGYAESMDGIHWSKAKELLLQAAPHQIRKVRTPLGLVAEPDGTFTVFFTGYTRTDSWGEVWMMRVKVEE